MVEKVRTNNKLRNFEVEKDFNRRSDIAKFLSNLIYKSLLLQKRLVKMILVEKIDDFMLLSLLISD